MSAIKKKITIIDINDKYADQSKLEKIAEIKMSDLNANTVGQAKEMIRGTAKSMGIEIKG